MPVGVESVRGQLAGARDVLYRAAAENGRGDLLARRWIECAQRPVCAMNCLLPNQHVTRQLHDVSSPFGWFNIGHRTTYFDDDAMCASGGAALAISFQGLPSFLTVN